MITIKYKKVYEQGKRMYRISDIIMDVDEFIRYTNITGYYNDNIPMDNENFFIFNFSNDSKYIQGKSSSIGEYKLCVGKSYSVKEFKTITDEIKKVVIRMRNVENMIEKLLWENNIDIEMTI